jgi:signal peptidase I
MIIIRLLNNKNAFLSRFEKSSILALFMATPEHMPYPNITRKLRLWLFIENVLYIIAAIILAAIIQAFVIRPFIVNGSSMEPNIEDKQYLIVDEISYRVHPPKRGDVIVLKSPPEPTKFYIKRIIGLPGETIVIKGTTVSIANKEHPKGFVLSESYLLPTLNQHPTFLTVIVPDDGYFVMGDNRDGSYDSRSWGILPAENVRGRALLRLLPLNKISYLPARAHYEENN